jgi:hypothetical protein
MRYRTGEVSIPSHPLRLNPRPDPGAVPRKVNGHWTVIAANQGCRSLFGRTVVGRNFVSDSLTNPAAAETIVNWPEVALAGLDQLRRASFAARRSTRTCNAWSPWPKSPRPVRSTAST